MAFIPFYIQSGGSNINAGSSTNNTADVTQTNGGWSTVTNIFTAASGTPFSAVVANTDWASIYVDGATTGVFTGLVTTVGGGGASITISSTIRIGTPPTTSATARSCKVNGAWASPAVLTNTSFGTGTLAFSMQVNVKATTYSSLATINWGIIGTAAFPFWLRGYNTTLGDLDNDTTNSLSKPIFSFNAAANMSFSGAFGLMSAISLLGNITGNVLAGIAATTRMIRCRFENTSSNAGAVAANINGPGSFIGCWFKCPTTATGVISLTEAFFLGCVAEGGITGWNALTRSPRCVQCVGLNNGTNAWKYSTGIPLLNQCTISGPGGDGIAITGAIATSQAGYITSCLFRNCTGWGINNSSGTVPTNIQIALNDYYNCSSGTITGWGDNTVNFWQQTESSDPCTSSTNLSLVAGANALNNGFPGIFENESFISYVDCGAVQGPHIGGSAPLVPPEVSTVFMGL